MSDHTEHVPLRDRLRAIRMFDTDLPGFDPAEAPDSPVALFTEWLDLALRSGVPEPHVVNLATADVAGRPSSRFLILKDVDEAGWRFASSSASPKGRDLAANPNAAIACYWAKQGRQIRARGPVVPEPPERSAADFLARSPDARAEALAGGQSEPLDSEKRAVAVAEARARIAADPGTVAPDWTLYTLQPESVEFWQAARNREHVRLRYTREGSGRWTRTLLRP
ncbi:pyridoxal 5'-phosphate synthase [Thermobifida halotolerans]|uniref:Pyridoxal 5'-phosphate synthase n=1 Tax=Thermobifida halotolerans TaxID=483545 RepID=A0A399G0L0_9ACTN|nr:pyridoxal 5'-phosphate synthase [Thermobifida halotolerans]UOE18703.1 pyridoxal 5'-phosphate synthase [Thermobifida halotolerans]